MIVNWGKYIEKILLNEGYSKGVWMYHDFRSCLIWSVWNNAFPNAKWIIVRRTTADIIQSCVDTGFMKAFKNKLNQIAVKANSEQEGWLWLVNQYEQRFKEMEQNNLNCKQIWPEQLIKGNYSQLYKLLDWLGLSWNHKIEDRINLVDQKGKDILWQ